MRLTKWVIEQAAAHTRRQLDDLRFDLHQTRGKLQAAQDEVDALRKRVAEMAPHKQFMVVMRQLGTPARRVLDIEAVVSANGVNTITVAPVTLHADREA